MSVKEGCALSRVVLWKFAWRSRREEGGSLASLLAIGSAFALLFGAGCVADKMQSFVGQDIGAVMFSYGPPVNQFDLGGASRAFQWSRVSIDTTPETAVETTSKDRKGRKTTTTEFVGGSETIDRCLYTFIATWTAPRQSWVVTGFRPPSFDCAIGDLS